jgi:hypothetical protein
MDASILRFSSQDDLQDAYKLAELLYFKPRLLHPIQHRSREAQADLSWTRAREALVESRTQLINAVRGISKAFANRLQKCSAKAFTAKLASQVPEVIRGAVAPLLETIDHLNEQIHYCDEMETHIACERYPKCRLLEQVIHFELNITEIGWLDCGWLVAHRERFLGSHTVWSLGRSRNRWAFGLPRH